MDEMRQYEIIDLLELIPWADKTSYEQMRYIVWASLKPYLKQKNITPRRLLPFYTDTHTSEEIEPEFTEQQIEEMRRQMLDKYTRHN